MIHDRRSSGLIQPFTLRWLILLLGVPLTYAIVRCHVFMGIEWAHFPLFVANKAYSLAAVFFIAASYSISKTRWIYSAHPGKRLILTKLCGLMGFSLASIHAFMALLMFSPRTYPILFSDRSFTDTVIGDTVSGDTVSGNTALHQASGLNLTGELAMAFGVLSLWCLAVTAITSLPFIYDAIGAERWHRGQMMGYISLTLLAGHVLVLGLSRWSEPADWPGGLPPISMVAFVAAMIPVLIKLVSIVTPDPATD